MSGLRSESVRALFALAIIRAFERFNGSLTPGKLTKYHQLARPESRDSVNSFVIALLRRLLWSFRFHSQQKILEPVNRFEKFARVFCNFLARIDRDFFEVFDHQRRSRIAGKCGLMFVEKIPI